MVTCILGLFNTCNEVNEMYTNWYMCVNFDSLNSRRQSYITFIIYIVHNAS